MMLSPDLVIAGASDAYLAVNMSRREDIVGRDPFEVFPDDPGDPQAQGVRNLRASLDHVRHRRGARRRHHAEEPSVLRQHVPGQPPPGVLEDQR